MNVIVVGCGRVGAELATNLVADGHSVSVIDKVRRAFRRLPEGWSGQTFQGLGFDRDTLVRAGITEADAVAAVTSGDNSNVLTARIARETYEVPRVVARIYDPRRAVIYQRLGIATVATVTWTTDQITRRLIPGSATADWTDATGELMVVERVLPETWAGKRLTGLWGDGVRVMALLRAGRSLLVDNSTIGHDGDLLYVLVRRAALEGLDAELASDGGEGAMKVAIAGAGNVGRFMAVELSRAGHRVMVIEQNPQLVERYRQDTPDVTWCEGDACEVDVLKAAGLDDVEVMVAATGDDEDNLVVSLLAKQEFAVPRVVARVNHPENAWLFNETWGVDVSVSTPHLLTSVVEEAVSIGSLVRLLSFAGGEAGLVEVTLADGSPAAGRSLAELDIPRTSTVVAVVRSGNVVVPRGDTTLHIGDEVILLTTSEGEGEVRRQLIG